MIARILTIVCLALCLAPPLRAEGSVAEVRQKVPALIEQLGSEKYIERRSAQRELKQIGLAAFDKLYAARDDPDPEIATTASRLLGEMTVRWAQPGDSPAVRGLMDLYGRIGEGERSERIDELANLEDWQGLSALCRIARFELSPTVADRAAVALLMRMPVDGDSTDFASLYELPEGYLDDLHASLSEMDELYGPSYRRSIQWLQLFVAAGENPAGAVAGWSKEFQQLRGQLKRNEVALDTAVAPAVGWSLLREQLKAGQQEAAAATAEALAALEPQMALAALTVALEWMTQADADTAIERTLAEKPGSVLYGSKRGLYLAAKTRLNQRREQEAERLAQLAFERGADPQEIAGPRLGRAVIDGRVVVGLRLRREGHAEWAAREFRKSVEEDGPLSPNGAIAAWELADLLQDAARWADASSVLKDFIEAVEQDDQSRATYNRMAESRDQLLRPLQTLKGSEAYFRALGAHEARDLATEQAALLEAVELDPGNADILIAMYRAAPPEYPLRADALERIDTLAESFEAKIDQDPRSPISYNQWAWLISNTQGDYAKAVRYSLRSLALEPGDAGYLDTLGRCYYAAGNLEKAVEVQREAVEKEPRYQIMRRQLQMFEKALADKQGSP